MASFFFRNLGKAMIRTKQFEKDNLDTQLHRCLSAFDLTMLGIGNMAGAGIYILTGTVIRDKAGPAVFLSFLLAGVAAFLNALCYAELGSRIPKAGSAYTYTYIAGGEFLAFLIGWSVILEYVLSASSVARGWSGTLDSLFQGAISNGTKTFLFPNYHPPHWLADYPDLISFAIVLLLTIIVATGPKSSARFNNVSTVTNIIVVIFTTGLMLLHPNNHGENFARAETGGFMPFQFAGVIAGAATCFYSYIGFDAVTVSAEEASNPKRDMPIATGVSVGLVTVLFAVSSFSLVWFIPWDMVDRSAAFPAALRARNIVWASYVTGIGSLVGITSSLFTSMVALPRIVYAMASDGLLPGFLGYVFPLTQVPLVAIVVFGFLAAFLAMIFSIEALADFLSIGTLLAYTIVCVNVCILRYRNLETHPDAGEMYFKDVDKAHENHISPTAKDDASFNATPFGNRELTEGEKQVGKLRSMFRNFPILKDFSPGHAPVVALVILILLAIGLCCLVLLGYSYVSTATAWALVLLCIFGVGIILSVAVMGMHHQNTFFDTFKVPFVPVLPAFCILLNITLIVKLSPMTWIRFAVWTIIGLIIYFGYGITNSRLNKNNEEKQPLLTSKTDSQMMKLSENKVYPQLDNLTGSKGGDDINPQ